ncbi:hypothetical protein GQ600_14794 [Phytophthora cactorum]|nr:hypothetical protein GQ600_14794 [Phytophthora cactorum]
MALRCTKHALPAQGYQSPVKQVSGENDDNFRAQSRVTPHAVAAGGAEQEAHQDYTPRVDRAAATARVQRVPARGALTLQPATSLRHNGMPYTAVNYRQHCYLTYAKMNWEPDVVASVLPRTYDCKICGLKMLTLSTKDTQQFYCPANPKGAKHKVKRMSEDLPGASSLLFVW